MDVAELLGRFGVGMKDITKIRLGSGIVGKIAPMTNYLALALILLGALCVLKGAPWGACVAFALMAIVVYLVGTAVVVRVAARHPDMALLEGAELLAYRQQAFEVLVKGRALPKAVEIAGPDPTGPSIEPTEEASLLAEEADTEPEMSD